MNEFNIIEKYFKHNQQPNPDPSIELGIGDDGAIISPFLNSSSDPNQKIIIATDTLVSNIHFLENAPPDLIAHKALAVNLSDFAAMGATPKWFTLALTIPEAIAKTNEIWLEKFSKGLFQCADEFDCHLIGGDTTKGPLSITITLIGYPSSEKILKRCDAKVGDKIYVTGDLGGAAFEFFQHQTIDTPTPRIKEAIALADSINAAIDISDGLIADLNHILKASNVGATMEAANIPLSENLKSIDQKQALTFALTGGDDYELCLTVPAEKEAEFLRAAKQNQYKVTHIGEIQEEKTLTIFNSDGSVFNIGKTGYDHFA